jgi:AcrR family transcriptional regulator
VSKTTRDNRLSLERIHKAALDLVRVNGLGSLSMRSLAGELGVDPMAIYYYAPNKATLIAALHEFVLAELLSPPLPNGSWQNQLRELLERFHSCALKTPQLFPGLIASSNSSPGMARAMNAVYGILEQAGLDPIQRVRCGDVVFSVITGFVLLEISGSAVTDNLPPSQAAQHHGLEHTAALADPLANNKFPESLRFALDFLIRGIEAEPSTQA